MDISSITGGAAGASNSSAQLASDFDTFLTLLTTQLANQDPLDPMDSSEFTNQLVQFSQVEQQIQTNKNLETLAGLTAFNGATSAAGYLGRTVMFRADTTTLSDTGATWHYELGRDVATVDLRVLDGNGKVVFEQTGENTFGRHEFNWDGITTEGDQLTDGGYTLEVVAKDVDDETVDAGVFVQGEVTKIEFIGGESILSAAGNDVPLGAVLSIIEPTAG